MILTNAETALTSLQQADGGWSGGHGSGLESSIEETGVALEALAGTTHVDCLNRGAQWLMDRVENGTWTECSPIGFYFAKLWYHEKLYPQLTTVAALGAVLNALHRNSAQVPHRSSQTAH
jgi:squalene-hopene/tetraprenyl-beta-curcumene cyclase